MPTERPARSRVCRRQSLADTFRHIASFTGGTESAEHIKPLHWYAACRLVLEGGFLPDEIMPRPPFTVEHRGNLPPLVRYDESVATGGEQIVYGGLKTKNVDVVVTKPALGPVMAISLKGMQGAFRNLTNRLEEMVGECTNLHITYPALTLGYLIVLNGNRMAAADSDPPIRRLRANDLAFDTKGNPVSSIVRIHYALTQLHGRRGIREDGSRYEATSLSLIETSGPKIGALIDTYPSAESPLRFENFFNTLNSQYDERFVYGAPLLVTRRVTPRRLWSPASPVFAPENSAVYPSLDFVPRMADDPAQPVFDEPADDPTAS